MTLLGIIASSKRAAVAATGGNEVKTVGLYKYHFFTSNGTFTVTNGGDVQVISAGGGVVS